MGRGGLENAMLCILLFNKFYGVLLQFIDVRSFLLCLMLLGFVIVFSVYSAGCLDCDSEGLLVLTDDGVL